MYALVASPREWNRWAVWHQRDPGMKIDYSGPASGAGASWSWQSASEGAGRMNFTSAEPPRRLAYELHFTDFGTTSKGEFRIDPTPGGSRVTWTMNGDSGARIGGHRFSPTRSAPVEKTASLSTKHCDSCAKAAAVKYPSWPMEMATGVGCMWRTAV